jgi:hypothetical protein
MKKLLALCILFLFISCGAIKILSNQEINNYQACSEITFQEKILLMPIEIDNSKSQFIFDTGATISALIDTTAVHNFHKKKYASLGSPKGADGKKIESKLLTCIVKNPLFESKNKVLTFVDFQKTDCNKSAKDFSGIIGLDLFFDKNLSMQLDFTNNKVCNITNQQFQQYLLDNQFQLLKSKCKANQIFVYLNIEGKEYPFKLDTGYTGNIIMPFDADLNFKNDKKLELEGSLFQTISSHTSGSEIVYEKMPIALGSYNLEVKLNVSTSIKAQNIGINFIKAFDWLIDYNHNNVYIKRNQNPIESTINKKISYYAKVNQDKLQIVVKEKSQSKHQLGDQIISVNGQKVTTENQCELQDLLNKTDDWNSLQLEVIPAQK